MFELEFIGVNRVVSINYLNVLGLYQIIIEFNDKILIIYIAAAHYHEFSLK